MTFNTRLKIWYLKQAPKHNRRFKLVLKLHAAAWVLHIVSYLLPEVVEVLVMLALVAPAVNLAMHAQGLRSALSYYSRYISWHDAELRRERIKFELALAAAFILAVAIHLVFVGAEMSWSLGALFFTLLAIAQHVAFNWLYGFEDNQSRIITAETATLLKNLERYFPCTVTIPPPDSDLAKS